MSSNLNNKFSKHAIERFFPIQYKQINLIIRIDKFSSRVSENSKKKTTKHIIQFYKSSRFLGLSLVQFSL